MLIEWQRAVECLGNRSPGWRYIAPQLALHYECVRHLTSSLRPVRVAACASSQGDAVTT